VSDRSVRVATRETERPVAAHEAAHRVATYEAERRVAMIRIAIAATITALLLLAPRSARGQDWHETSYARQVSGESDLAVKIEYGAGKLNIAPAAPGTLYRANLRYDADAFTPEVSYANNRLRFGMESGNVRGRNLKEGRLDLRLSPDVPLELDLAFGATDATVELGGLLVRHVNIQTGASRTVLSVSSPNEEECRMFEVEVGAARFEARNLGNLNAPRLSLQGGVGEVILDFTGSWQQDMNAGVEMGLGTLTLRLPRGLGVRIVKDGLLASFDSQGLTKRGDVYYSENYEDTTYKLSLDLDAALGSIRVEWVDPQ
jgi:hypothetical protein